MSSDSEDYDYFDVSSSDTDIDDRLEPPIKTAKRSRKGAEKKIKKKKHPYDIYALDDKLKQPFLQLFFSNADDVLSLKNFFENIANIKEHLIVKKVYIDRILDELFKFLHISCDKYDVDNNNVFAFIIARLYSKCKGKDDKETASRIWTFANTMKKNNYDLQLLLPLVAKKNELYKDSYCLVSFSDFVSSLIDLISRKAKLSEFFHIYQKYVEIFKDNEIYTAYIRSILNNELRLNEYKNRISNEVDVKMKTKIMREMNDHLNLKIPLLYSILEEKSLIYFDIRYMSSFSEFKTDFTKLRNLNIYEYDNLCAAMFYIQHGNFTDCYDIFKKVMLKFGGSIYISSLWHMLNKYVNNATVEEYKSFIKSRQTNETTSHTVDNTNISKYRIYIDDLNLGDVNLINMLLKQINWRQEKNKGKNMLQNLEELQLDDKPQPKSKQSKYVEVDSEGTLVEKQNPTTQYKRNYEYVVDKKYNTGYLPWLTFGFKSILIHPVDVPEHLLNIILNCKKSKEFKSKTFYYIRDFFFEFLHMGVKEQRGDATVISLNNDKITVEIVYIGVDNVVRFHDSTIHILEYEYRSKKKATSMQEKIAIIERKPVYDAVLHIACWKLSTSFVELQVKNTKLQSATSNEIQNIINAYKKNSENVKQFIDLFCNLISILHPNICPPQFVDDIINDKYKPEMLVYIDAKQLIVSGYFNSFPDFTVDTYNRALYEIKKMYIKEMYEKIISFDETYTHGGRKKIQLKKDPDIKNILLLVPSLQTIEKSHSIETKSNTKKHLSAQQKEIIKLAVNCCRLEFQRNYQNRDLKNDICSCMNCGKPLEFDKGVKSLVDHQPATFCNLECLEQFEF